MNELNPTPENSDGETQQQQENAAPGGPSPTASRTRRDAIVIAILVIVVAFMIWSAVHVSRRHAGPQTATIPGGSLVGRPAPNFQLTTLDGKQVSLSDYRGKAVLLNFWATWCGPCRIEMPWFVDLEKKYQPQGFEILGVAMDDSGEKAIKDFTQQIGTNYPILLGKDAVGDAYGVEGMPTTFFIGRDGKVVDQTLGLFSKKELEERVQRAISAGSSTQPGASLLQRGPAMLAQARGGSVRALAANTQ